MRSLMKNALLVTFITIFALASPVSAQNGNDAEVIDMTSSELSSLARKLASLRARRVMLMRQQQMQWQQYYAAQARMYQQSTAPQAQADQGAAAGAGQTEPASSAPMDQAYDIVYDTLIQVGPDLEETITVTERRVPKGQGEAMRNNATLRSELAAVRNRLDRQEQLLMEIRDNAVIAKSAAPATKPDSSIQRIVSSNPNQITQEDLRRMNDEMARLNGEVDRLRIQTEYEERRRRSAEERMADDLRDRDRYERERLNRDLDANLDRNRRGLQPNLGITTTAPTVIRDTVYVDRASRPDTVRGRRKSNHPRAG